MYGLDEADRVFFEQMLSNIKGMFAAGVISATETCFLEKKLVKKIEKNIIERASGKTSRRPYGNVFPKSTPKYQYSQKDLEFWPINYYDQKLQTAKDNGFNSVYDFVYDVYQKEHSCKKVGLRMGISDTAARMMLKKMGIKINKPGGRTKKNPFFS